MIAGALVAGFVLTVVTGPTPALAVDGQDPVADCRTRGYWTADVFPSRGVASLQLDLGAASGIPHPPFVPTLDSGPLVVLFNEGNGDTIVCRSAPLPAGCTDDCLIETEMIQLSLRGVHPLLGDVQVDVDPRIPSVGAVAGASVDPVGNIVGGDSFFDVYVDIRIEHPALGTVRAGSCLDPSQPFTFFCMPFRVEADLTDVTLPPVAGVSYKHPIGRDVPIWTDPDPTDPEGEFVIGALLGGCHKPYDPAEDEHHLCILSGGTITPAPGDDECTENVVRLLAVDSSLPDHQIVAVTSTAIGPLVVTPWTPVWVGGVVAWSAFAVTNVEQCADVGLTATAAFADLHSSPPATATWRQHA